MTASALYKLSARWKHLAQRDDGKLHVNYYHNTIVIKERNKTWRKAAGWTTLEIDSVYIALANDHDHTLVLTDRGPLWIVSNYFEEVPLRLFEAPNGNV